MTEDDNEVVAEHYHAFDNIPVVVCVLETRRGFFAVGYSSTSMRKFDAEIGQTFARGNAQRVLRRNIEKWQAA